MPRPATLRVMSGVGALSHGVAPPPFLLFRRCRRRTLLFFFRSHKRREKAHDNVSCTVQAFRYCFHLSTIFKLKRNSFFYCALFPRCPFLSPTIPYSVDSVRVVWSERSPPPRSQSSPQLFDHRSPVSFHAYPTTSINNRLVLTKKMLSTLVEL